MRSTVLLGAIGTKGAGGSVFLLVHPIVGGAPSAVHAEAEDLVVEPLARGVDGRQMR
ncbi:hypothetical protein GCWB2_02295 [Gordonia rubripertincta]|nr:hypothetical protein GCWB2_02295 [Gordonia rubripertincta]